MIKRCRLGNSRMRLTSAQRHLVVSAARRAFGADVQVRLFGSRLDDRRRGGDIDLYITTALDDADALVKAKLEFLAELDANAALAGEKIDVVLNSPLHVVTRAIDQVAQSEGVRL